MPLLDTPQIAQDGPHKCGKGAFNCLFRFHHRTRPFPDWGELADPVRGIGPETLELFVKKEFPSYCIGHIDLKHLRFLSAFTPVLCLITVDHELDHWVCVRGVTRDYVYTQDPAEGRLRYPHAEWAGVWKDAAAGGIYRRFALTGWR